MPGRHWHQVNDPNPRQFPQFRLDEIDVGRLEDPTSLAGQLLRLNSDGTTPRDTPSYSPIVLRWLTQPVIKSTWA